MPEYIYLDNFRGFYDLAVPIRDTTFLVGENSTGKSSFISLYNILHDFNSFYEVDFGSDQYNLGGFTDIVSPNATNKDSFTVGLARFIDQESNTNVYSLLARFTNNEGLPTPDLYICLTNRDIMIIQNIQNKYYYRIGKIPERSVPKTGRKLFDVLIGYYNATKNKLREFKTDTNLPVDYFIFYMPQLVASYERHKKNFSFDLQFLSRLFGRSCVWFAPIRTRPRVLYAGSRKKYSSEGEHTPYLLRKMLSTATDRKKFIERLNSFGRQGNLFDHIQIHKYGTEGTSPFEVQICFKKDAYTLSNVGYGVSQILPIIVELISRDKMTVFNIQQPEVHLHPRAQAAIGGLIYELSIVDNKKFIIETHSEYLLDRFRTSMRNVQIDDDIKASILFFERINGKNNITEIPIHPDGKYDPEQPASFRKFFLEEKLNILGID